MRNNRKEDSAFAIELLVALKYTMFTGEILAQSTLYSARASLAAGISEMPFARHCASAIQQIHPVVSYCFSFPAYCSWHISLAEILDGAGTAIIHHRPATSSCCLWMHRGIVQDLSALYLLGSISLFLGPTNPCLLSPGPQKIQFVVHKVGKHQTWQDPSSPFRKWGAFLCQEQWQVSTAWVKQSTATDLCQEWIQAGALWTERAASHRAHAALWDRGKARVTPCLVSQCEQWDKEGRKMTWTCAVVYYKWLQGDCIEISGSPSAWQGH